MLASITLITLIMPVVSAFASSYSAIRADNKDNLMSYQKLEKHQQQIHRFSHLAAICGWDQAA
ncbi:MAG: hypothetical protein ACRDDA_14000, partial [Aeromonas sp.]